MVTPCRHKPQTRHHPGYGGEIRFTPARSSTEGSSAAPYGSSRDPARGAEAREGSGCTQQVPRCPCRSPFFSATALGTACQDHTLTRRLQSHGAGLSKKKTSAPKPGGAASLLTKESGEAAARLAASLPTLGARSRLSPRLQPLSRVFCTYPNYKQPERLPRGGKGTKREVMSLNQPARGGRVKDLRDIGALMWLGESLLVTCWEFSPEPWFGASSGFKYCLGRVPEGNRSQTILNDQGT